MEQQQTTEEKQRRLEAYLRAVKSHGPQPGADLLAGHLRPMTPAEMDSDLKSFADFCRGRHEGETVVVLGTGDSLRRLDQAQLRRFTTIGCNGIGRVFQPDYYLILDPFVYALHKDVFLACPNTRILSTFTSGECDQRIYYRYENLIGLSPDEIYSADNTGFVQLSMAYMMGARRVVVAGYDGYPPGAASFHCYDEPEVEAARVRHEWHDHDEAGDAKRALMREAFAYARRRFAEEGRELYLLTDSYLLGDLLEKISWADFIRLPAKEPGGDD